MHLHCCHCTFISNCILHFFGTKTSSIRIDSRDQSDHSGQCEHLLKRQNWPLSSWRKNHTFRTGLFKSGYSVIESLINNSSASQISNKGVKADICLKLKGNELQVLHVLLWLYMTSVNCCIPFNQSLWTVSVWCSGHSKMSIMCMSHPQKAWFELQLMSHMQKACQPPELPLHTTMCAFCAWFHSFECNLKIVSTCWTTRDTDIAMECWQSVNLHLLQSAVWLISDIYVFALWLRVPCKHAI